MSKQRVLAGWTSFQVTLETGKGKKTSQEKYDVQIDVGGFGSPDSLPAGMTQVIIEDVETMAIAGFGLSRKAEKDADNFIKGVKLALGRALDRTVFTKEQRKQVWEQFRNWLIEEISVLEDGSGELPLNFYD